MATAIAGTVREALRAATDALAAAGVSTSRLDAELLLAEAADLTRAELAATPERGVEAPAARWFGSMVRRRVAREPVAYILGRKGFRNLEIQVDARVLIPRPETELLVDVALERSPRTVLDVGTGSGAIALALADELPDASVAGVDVSEGAIEVARNNAGRLGLAVDFQRVGAHCGSGHDERTAEGGWELVVANLPYVRDDEWPTLPPDITRFEPREALLGGPDGLGSIRTLLADLPDCAALALEVGEGQAPVVAELVRSAGFSAVDARPDLAGIQRVVLGTR